MSTTTSSSSSSTAGYTKLRDGSWGIRVPGAVADGDEITVVKRNGEAKLERVGRVLWQGEGVSLCTIAASAPKQAPAGRVRYSRKRCWETGANCYSIDGTPYCEECGDHMYR